MASDSDPTGSSEPQWHVSLGGKKQGPFSDERVAELAASHKLTAKSLAWKNGMPNWMPCAAIPELAPLFGGQHAQGRDTAEVQGPRVGASLRGASGRIRPWHLVVLGIPLLALGAFSLWRAFLYTPPQDDLISSFSLESQGSAVEVLKVEKQEDAYLLYRMQRSGWSGGEPVTPMAEKEFLELFGKDWKAAHPIGLVEADGNAAILKVEPGWTNGEFTCKTGYFFMNASGPVELAKAESKALGLPSLARKTPEPTPTPSPTPSPTPRPQVRRSPVPTPRRTPKSTPIPQASPNDTTVVPLVPRPSVTPTPLLAPPSDSPTPDPDWKSEGLAISPPGATAKTEAGLRTELAGARADAEAARVRLAQVDDPAKGPLQRLFLESGEMLMETSRELEDEGNLASAISYAQQAEKAYREGITKVGGPAR